MEEEKYAQFLQINMKNGNFVDTPSLDEATIVNDYIEFYRDNTANTEGLQFIKAYLSISRFLD